MSSGTDAERLARRILECTEEVGIQMAREEKPDVHIEEPWTLETISPQEREGLIRAAVMLTERGYVVLGPNV